MAKISVFITLLAVTDITKKRHFSVSMTKIVKQTRHKLRYTYSAFLVRLRVQNVFDIRGRPRLFSNFILLAKQMV